MKKLFIEDLINYNFLSSLGASPDEKKIAFVLHKSNGEKEGYDSNIWIYQCEEKSFKQLTTTNSEKNFSWLNSNEIIFSSSRDGKPKEKMKNDEVYTSFYTIDINGGEAKKFYNFPFLVKKIIPIDENNFLILAQNKCEDNDFYNGDYETIDEIPYWSNGNGFTYKKRDGLFLFDKTNEKFTLITDKYLNVDYFSYKNREILFVGNRYENMKHLENGIYIYNLDTTTTKTLLSPDKYRVVFAEFFNDKILCAMSDMKKYGINQNPDFYLIDENTITFFKENDTRLINNVGSDCRYGNNSNYFVKNNTFYYITTTGYSSFIMSLNKEGKIECLTKNNGSVDGFTLINNKIYFIGMKNHNLQELYLLENNKEILISNFNKSYLENKKISVPQRINIFNGDTKIDGWVIKPVDYNPNQKYPAILDIHGGPKTAYGEVFYHEMQVWANLGYFVFFCNPRGSDGKGDEFSDIRGKYGTIDYEDIMKFSDFVIETYNINKDKVGVTGGSYGGYMTNWIIGHTNRFACAVSQRSIANWISKFGTTDIGYYFNVDQNGATPWSDAEKLWWHSPMKYANLVKTPTLFIHSDQDYRCWLPEAMQMFTALKYNGVPSRLCIFKGENHELSRSGKPKNRINRLKEITAWFEYYLK